MCLHYFQDFVILFLNLSDMGVPEGCAGDMFDTYQYRFLENFSMKLCD